MGAAAMKFTALPSDRILLSMAACAALTFAAARITAQDAPYERTFRQSKAEVEKALKQLQAPMSGRLPVLEGFAIAGSRPLDRYQRAYYQSSLQIRSTASGASVVRVNTKITAWYADSIPSRSGYQLLTSNGRIEGDLLDELAEQLVSLPEGVEASAAKPAAPPSKARKERPATAESAISAPMPTAPETGAPFSSSLTQGLSAQELRGSKTPPNSLQDQGTSRLQAEAPSITKVLT